MIDECRKALRSVTRRRGLALAVVATLTLSIGATSAIFSAIDAVLLKPLPYPNAERLVTVREQTESGLSSPVALVRLQEWSQLTRSFEALAGSYPENLTDTSGAVPERMAAVRTSPGFFGVLRTPAALGRTFITDEERPGGPRAIVLSDALWRSRFGADPAIVGRTLRIQGEGSVTIVGVMPSSFTYPTVGSEAWIPTRPPPFLATSREARFYAGIARLRPDVTLEQAQQDLAAAQARLGDQYPATDGGRSAAASPLKEEMVGGVRRSLWLLFGAVLLMLFAACGNIAGLLLADWERREQQVAVQFALGAPRHSIVRQRLLEGLMLALTGSAGGLIVGYWGIRAIRALAIRLPRVSELEMDWRLVAFTLGSGVLATLCCALLPALQTTRRDAGRSLQHGTRAPIGGKRRIQRALVAAQIAFAIVLLVGAGLFIRSFVRLQHVSPGFDPENVLVFRMSAAWGERPQDTGGRYQRTRQRLADIPGVVGVALASPLPAGPEAEYPPSAFTIAGRPRDGTHVAINRQLSDGYFETLRIPILQGRGCRPEKPGDSAAAIVVNQAFASRFFPGESPLGHRLQPNLPTALEIVGVAGDAREQSLLEAPEPSMYLCGGTGYMPFLWYVVRVDPERPVNATTIRAALHEVEPLRAVYDFQAMAAAVGESTAQSKLNTLLFAFFGATAMLLVAVGLYAMLSQFVGERTREIGVRLAIGARPAQVLAQVIGQTTWPIAAGLAAGLVSALLLARFMTALVYGISARDPVTFVVVPVVLAAVAMVAAFVPARRAAGLDPLAALREQ